VAQEEARSSIRDAPVHIREDLLVLPFLLPPDTFLRTLLFSNSDLLPIRYFFMSAIKTGIRGKPQSSRFWLLTYIQKFTADN
jgi:hypothetical protein